MYQKNRDVYKLVIETTEGTIAIEKKIEGNQQNIVVSYEMKEDKKSKISFSANFENLESLQNIKENYELIMSLPEVAESSTTTDVDSEVVEYKFSNDVNFTDSATVEDFSSDNSLMLTDYDSDQVSSFLNAVVERISEVNEQQMGQLGLEASENPIVINMMIPFSYIYLGNMYALNQVNSNMSEAEINNFNQKFEAYESTNLKGVTVKGLLSTISLNNQSEETSNEIKEINYNGEEYEASEQNITLIKGEIDTEKSYRVEFEKDQDTGLIYRAVINEK